MNKPRLSTNQALLLRGRSRSTLEAACVLVVAFSLIVGFRTTSSSGKESDQLQSELQKDSFSSLSWSLAEFKVEFQKGFGELLLQLQQGRKKAETRGQAPVDNSELAEILENVILEAQQALSVPEMQECLLNFYRAAGLTNKFLQLHTELQSRNSNRVSFPLEKAFLEAIRRSQAEPRNVPLALTADSAPVVPVRRTD